MCCPCVAQHVGPPHTGTHMTPFFGLHDECVTKVCVAGLLIYSFIYWYVYVYIYMYLCMRVCVYLPTVVHCLIVWSICQNNVNTVNTHLFCHEGIYQRSRPSTTRHGRIPVRDSMQQPSGSLIVGLVYHTVITVWAASVVLPYLLLATSRYFVLISEDPCFSPLVSENMMWTELTWVSPNLSLRC